MGAVRNSHVAGAGRTAHGLLRVAEVQVLDAQEAFLRGPTQIRLQLVVIKGACGAIHEALAATPGPLDRGDGPRPRAHPVVLVHCGP